MSPLFVVIDFGGLHSGEDACIFVYERALISYMVICFHHLQYINLFISFFQKLFDIGFVVFLTPLNE